MDGGNHMEEEKTAAEGQVQFAYEKYIAGNKRNETMTIKLFEDTLCVN